ncbi:hypothetical protein Daus18300_002551 [Diaporthe australafricana]|uniref:J domain-containing protein n=1 Tax=Diaporthe australafricana TaxID=127596 RepID=A0ABR3XMM2_9PEZI
MSEFPAKAAFRSIYLREIYFQIHKSTVGELLVAEGISANNFRLYWDTGPVSHGHHNGFCWIEFWTRDQAIWAWARLDGLAKWTRTLIVGSVNRYNALRPSALELHAAKGPHPAGSIDPASGSAPPPQISSHGSEITEATYPGERNFYADLGLPGQVDDMTVIKRQYTKLALEMHPGKGGSLEQFQVISNAYQFLSNLEKKTAFDHRQFRIPRILPASAIPRSRPLSREEWMANKKVPFFLVREHVTMSKRHLADDRATASIEWGLKLISSGEISLFLPRQTLPPASGNSRVDYVAIVRYDESIAEFGKEVAIRKGCKIILAGQRPTEPKSCRKGHS